MEGPETGAVEAIDPGFRPLDKAAAYAISAFIVGFGVWILVAGLSSSAPALWFCVALVPIAIGTASAIGPSPRLEKTTRARRGTPIRQSWLRARKDAGHTTAHHHG